MLLKTNVFVDLEPITSVTMRRSIPRKPGVTKRRQKRKEYYEKFVRRHREGSEEVKVSLILQTFYIDHHGYFDIADEIFAEVTRNNDGWTLLSQLELRLVLSWILFKYELRVKKQHLGLTLSEQALYFSLKEQVPDDIDIPIQIYEWFENYGAFSYLEGRAVLCPVRGEILSGEVKKIEKFVGTLKDDNFASSQVSFRHLAYLIDQENDVGIPENEIPPQKRVQLRPGCGPCIPTKPAESKNNKRICRNDSQAEAGYQFSPGLLSQYHAWIARLRDLQQTRPGLPSSTEGTTAQQVIEFPTNVTDGIKENSCNFELCYPMDIRNCYYGKLCCFQRHVPIELTISQTPTEVDYALRHSSLLSHTRLLDNMDCEEVLDFLNRRKSTCN
ncbi:hypothetical protein TRICI_004121 [Trichomonascus ciferrii]|uniref:Uncharacterized protein n=1 Tax=Trichomonascus ciferrii TaxID=44093 RepID=A0A642V7W1_9ASCO|nr:hypothetical protein TRICI_004121 [Trichomonascus ciferrii]